jgi:hypothetical protein
LALQYSSLLLRESLQVLKRKLVILANYLHPYQAALRLRTIPAPLQFWKEVHGIR